MIHLLVVFQVDARLIMELLLDLMQACNGTLTKSPIHCLIYVFQDVSKATSGIKVYIHFFSIRIANNKKMAN